MARIDVDGIATPVASKLPIAYAKAHKILVTGEDEERVDVRRAPIRSTRPRSTTSARSSSKPVEAAVVQRRESGRRHQPRLRAQRARRRRARDQRRQRAEEELEDILDSDDDAPIIRWVNALFLQGGEGARERHPHRARGERGLVRYRIDGELYVAKRANKQFMSSIIARVKIMAALNIAEKRLPQDGRISLKIAGKSIDVRVSTIPTSRGSSAS